MQTVYFDDINSVLSKWAANDPPIEDFTVENVLFAIGVDDNSYELVLKYLMSKQDFELIPKKMLLCPNNHKIQSFGLEEVVEDYFDCHCGETDFFPEPDNYLLVFEFTDCFISQCKKKNRALRSNENSSRGFHLVY
ncbi:MAG: hypothetical protein KZY73_03055 [Bacillaceae bacterium]|uniref:hypothetical protein n=1 Tax=Bacillus safensis TaxID=561879 RepID=UPI001D19159C|nr:hypothetical protein [Bacillus safensis]MBW4850959.1 hypothetical protein [Bacillaceae bacterium]MBW4851750.1 hypothetical protein [Bacillaceae bacterium]MBW4855947.1 hypothetical protein [Bacillaceae bacterium]